MAKVMLEMSAADSVAVGYTGPFLELASAQPQGLGEKPIVLSTVARRQ
jgi:hypothetical protein